METNFTYLRQDAIEDGVLVNITPSAKQAGFKYPVALTERLNNTLLNIPPLYEHEDYFGRLWDVLTCCRYAAKTSKGDTILFQVILHTENNENLSSMPALVGIIHQKDNLLTREIPIILKAICHGGDHREPVITIMYQDED